MSSGSRDYLRHRCPMIDDNTVEMVPVVRLSAAVMSQVQDIAVREVPLTVYLNGEELVTMLCTPQKLEYLAVGFLNSEGVIESAEEIEGIALDEEKGLVWVSTRGGGELSGEAAFKRLITSGCGRGASLFNPSDAASYEKVESDLKVSQQEVLNLVKRMQEHSLLYRATGGVHSAALCSRDQIQVFSEDIGRHNAIDKVFGECLLRGIPTRDRILLTSGRISSEILLKATRRSVPIIVSKSAPTGLAVRLASRLGVTPIGFVRGKRMNIYANSWRVKPSGGEP